MTPERPAPYRPLVFAPVRPRRRWPGVALDLVALVTLPVLVYLVALYTEIGPTLLIFDWDHGREGLHPGDLLVLILVLPFWLAALLHLIRQLRR